MESIKMIKKFQEKNNIDINAEGIRIAIESLLTKYPDNKSREEGIRNYIEGMYPQLAERFERTRVINKHLDADHGAMNSFEFFEGYVNIISAIAKETSDRLVAVSKDAAEAARDTVNKAKANYDVLQAKYEKAQQITEEQGKSKDPIRAAYVKKEYQDPAELAKIAWQQAIEKQKTGVIVNPFESSKPYFGITADKAKEMLEGQLNSYTYMDVRKRDMEVNGLTDLKYMNELKKAFENKGTYQSASAEDQRKMQEVFATAQIMQETLDSKKGIRGFFWKLWYRAETKAMRNYINAAKDALEAASFDAEAESAAIENMATKGYFYGEYKATGAEKFFNENLTRRIERSDTKAVSAMPVKEQFFQMAFRPSKDLTAFQSQTESFNSIANLVDKNKDRIPKDMMRVFGANSQKMKAMKECFGSLQLWGPGELEAVDEKFEKIEESLLKDVSRDTYKPMKYDELKKPASAEKETVKVIITDPTATTAVSGRVETNPNPDLKKEAVK